MKTKSADKVKIESFDELFGSEGGSDNQIINLDISMLNDFKNHPFQVSDDEEMLSLAESIRENGVLVPIIVRHDKRSSGYEIIAGHRRKHASILAGLNTIPAICKEMSDADSVKSMVDSNIQREFILPSEKAFAYRMKMEAVKNQGKKGSNAAQEVGEAAGDKERTVQRYIRLSYLIPTLLELVDQGKIAILSGAAISYLSTEEQGWVDEAISKISKYPSGDVAVKLKDYSKQGKLTEDMAILLMQGEPKVKTKITIKTEKVRKYFPKDFRIEEMEEVIISLLEKWFDEDNREEM